MRVLVINLDRSPDRLATVMNELTRCGLSGERMPAIDGLTLAADSEGNIPGFKRRGRGREAYYRGSAGCYFSHLKALETAIAGDIWPCLIVEDDIQFNGDEGDIKMPVTDKQIVYLGGMEEPDTGRVYGAHAICYKSKAAAEAVHHYLLQHPNTVDSVLIRFHAATGMFHYCRPWQFVQRSGVSLISQTYVNRIRMSRDPVVVSFD